MLVRNDKTRRRIGLVAMLAVAAAVNAATCARAQMVPPPSDPAATLRQAIESNAGSPQQLCPAILPIIQATPSTASTLIEVAQAQPALLEPLAECLSEAQNTLKSGDPAGAAVVAQAVASATPAFQASYAVALAGDGGGGGGAPPAPAATAATGAGGGTGTSAPFSPVGFSGLSGNGGGPQASTN